MLGQLMDMPEGQKLDNGEGTLREQMPGAWEGDSVMTGL